MDIVTYRTGALAHVDLALEIQYRTSGESERLQVRVKGHVLEIIVVVGAPEWANEALVHNTSI